MSYQPENGSWIQEIASLVHQIGNTSSDNSKLIIDALNTIKDNTDVNNQQPIIDVLNSIKENTEVSSTPTAYDVIIEKTITIPGTTTTIVTKQPSPEQKPVSVVYKENIVQLPNTIVKVDIKDYWGRVCGSYIANSLDSDYRNCTRCVDKWLEDNPNFKLEQLTSSGTGCSFRKYKGI